MAPTRFVCVLAALAFALPARAEHLSIPAAIPATIPGAIVAATRECERDLACLAQVFADTLTTWPRTRLELRLEHLVAFEPGSARIYSPDRERISQLARAWREQPGLATITVEGFSDARARLEPENLVLSQLRADRVRDYLVRFGVDPAYVVSIGRGSQQPGRRVGLTIDMCARAAGDCRNVVTSRE